jgi:hypothetical protein
MKVAGQLTRLDFSLTGAPQPGGEAAVGSRSWTSALFSRSEADAGRSTTSNYILLLTNLALMGRMMNLIRVTQKRALFEIRRESSEVQCAPSVQARRKNLAILIISLRETQMLRRA